MRETQQQRNQRLARKLNDLEDQFTRNGFFDSTAAIRHLFARQLVLEEKLEEANKRIDDSYAHSNVVSSR